VPEVYNAFLWVNDPTAGASALNPVFKVAEATEMNGANAQQFSRGANDMFNEYRWGPVEIRKDVFVVAGKTRNKRVSKA
jgi:hypothetical protein